MKKIWGLVLGLMLVATATQAAPSLDLKAPIMQEVYYLMFERQIDNEVKDALVLNGMSEAESNLTLAYLKAQIDMPAIKRQTMECFNERDLNFAQKQNKEEDIAFCLTDYRDQLSYYAKEAQKNADLPEEMAVAGYFVAQGEIPHGAPDKQLMTVMKNVASHIALSRMNVRILHKKMLGCVRSLSQDKVERLGRITECSGDVSKQYNAEANKAMGELMPYVDFFLATLVAQAQ